MNKHFSFFKSHLELEIKKPKLCYVSGFSLNHGWLNNLLELV